MASSHAGEIPCPDPSVHTHAKGQNLSEAASTAALYVTNPERQVAERQVVRENPLGDDGKLSSKSAATSLKYAKATELPSFPSTGLSADSAGKAAMLAKDYKMKDLWQPEASQAGSRAALLAHRDGGKLDLWQHTPSAAGNSAATMAMKNKGLSPQLDYGYTADGKSRALLAATLSVNQGRKRAGSTPTPAPPAYPDSKNSAANALSAATASHRAGSKTATDGWNSEANQAARVQNLKAGKEWFGDRPPVDIDPDDTKHQAALHASAKSMAKQMYDYQNQKAAAQDVTSGTAGAQAAHANQTPQEQKDVKQEALKYIHLQDAAHKLAQERLAKVDKNMEAARYREYYGYGGEQAQQSSPRRQANRLSMRGRQRNRAMSEGGSTLDDSDDEEQARRIRTQMSQLSSGVNTVDEKKRSNDRAKLMAAAEKRVHDRMHDMDERVFQDTGKVPPAMMEEWENKARKRAQEEREQQAQNPGKTHIGGGKFIDTSEIEAIAAARLKPTLDQITDTAEKKRARDEEIRAEKEQQELVKRQEKAEKKQEKDEQKRTRDEEKAVAKQQKEEAKARKDEEKRIAQENKRKSHDVKRDEVAGAAGYTAEHDTEPTSKADKRTSTLGRIASKLRRKNKTENDTDTEQKTVDSRPATAIRSSIHETAEPTETTNGNVAPAIAVGTAVVSTEVVGDASVQKHDAAVVAPPPAIIEPEASEEDELYDTHKEMRPVTQTMTGHSGDHTGAVPVTGLSTARPDLERHISTIETSDEDDGDEWDEDDVLDDDDDDVVTRSQPNVTVGTFSHNELSPDQAQMAYSQLATDDEHHQHAAARSVQTPVTLPPSVESTTNRTAIASDSSQIEPRTTSNITSDSTGPAPHTIGPHTTDIANLLDPRVQPNPEVQKVAIRENNVANAETVHEHGDDGPAPHTIGPHASDLANIVDPRVQPEPELQKEAIREDNATNAETVHEHGDGGPAPHTIGPHSSDLANIVDPRAQPEPELMKEHSTTGPHKSDTLNKLDPNVTSESASKDGQTANTTAQLNPATATSSRHSKLEADDQPEKKGGLRGFLGKLRNKSSRSDNKLSKTSAEDKATSGSAARTNTVTTTSSESAGAPRLSALDGTPSASFSDAVSSSLDEDELTRGRAGRVAAPLTTSGHATDAEHPLSSVSTSNDEDTFEEARDHFDESLAPPAAFAGQSKDLRESGSPVRGTKFVEEL
nr:hypothetical protein CFP56_70043 [Quercus suber]